MGLGYYVLGTEPTTMTPDIGWVHIFDLFIAFAIPLTVICVVALLAQVLLRPRTVSRAISREYDDRNASGTAANNEPTEQLTKLAKLHADGALSDEEFKAMKAKVIGGERVQLPLTNASESASSAMKTPWKWTIGRAVGQSIYVIIFYSSVPVILLVAVFLLFSPSIRLSRFLAIGDPDCGSLDTQNLVTNIAEEHPDVIFSEFPSGLGTRALHNPQL